MPIAVWSDRFLTGIQILDDQHKELLAGVNRLHDILTGERVDKEVLTDHLHFLATYAVNHFKTEEGLMKEMGYPDLMEHLAEHDHLARRILELMERWTSDTPPSPMEFKKFCTEWLAHHVAEVDMGYSAWVAKLT